MSMQKQSRMRFLRSQSALETAEWAILGAAIILIVFAVYRALGAQIGNVIQQVMAALG